MNKKTRVKHMKKAAEQLNDLEGVEKAILDDYAPRTAHTGQIAVILESSESHKIHNIKTNLKSLAQKMSHTLKESELASYMVYEKPSTVYNAVGDPIGHDKSMYMIDVRP